MKIKLLLLFLIFVFASSILRSQTQENNNRTVAEVEKLLAEEKFQEASDLCDKLLKTDAHNHEYIFFDGVSKFGSSKFMEAEEGFSNIINDYRKTKEIKRYTISSFFYRARAYHNLYLFDNEIEDYKTILELGIDIDKDKQSFIKTSIKGANDAKEIYSQLLPLVVTRLAILNSKYDDHTPIPTADGTKIFFTSKRENGVGGNRMSPENKYYEDIWLWDINKGVTSKPINIGNPVDTEEHDATAGLSFDGKTLFIFKSGKNLKGDLWESNYIDSGWSEPEKLSKSINQKNSIERHASITPDGKTLFFSSDRKDGKGGRDIWISKLDEEGNWQKPENFIYNTEFDEEAPFFLKSSNTMYFSSKGYKNMGGFDVFKTTLQDDGSWTEPENLGFPLNTVDDDVFYFPLQDEKIAYFTRRNGDRSDIYKAFLWGEQENALMVEGIVYDNKSYTNIFPLVDKQGDTLFVEDNRMFIDKKLRANKDSVSYAYTENNNVIDSVYFVPENERISVFDLDNYIYTDIYETNSNAGDYKFVMLPKKNVKIIYSSKGYIFDTKDIFQSRDYPGYRIIYYSKLVKIESGETQKYKTLNYSPQSGEISPFTKKELELIAQAMTDYPELVVDFSANNDNSKEELNNERKNSAINFLTEKGIEKSRIFNDLSPRNIMPDNMEYTIYDQLSVQKAIADKETREKDTAIIVAQAEELEVELTNLYFNFDGKQLLFTKNEGVEKLTDYMLKNPTAKFEIVGHTDAVGSDTYNMKLSKNRALALKNYLESKGVNENQIVVSAQGERKPVAYNQIDGKWNEDSKKYNRRVEIKVIQQGEPKVKIIQYKEIPENFRIKD